MNPEVDFYFGATRQWSAELQLLRTTILATELIEELKWGVPCYTLDGANVVMLGRYKDNCVLSFLKGVLLPDPHGLLQKPGENTRTARVIRFTALSDIYDKEDILKAYLTEAIKLERSGIKAEKSDVSELELVGALQEKMDADPAFKAAFLSLTPGRQRGYHLYFSAAKQAKTREARIEKYHQRILDGKGINDCVCGRSQKMPSCDGSHQFIEKK